MNTSETLQLLFSGVVSISTIVYSVLTWKLVSETRKMREFQITPDINIYFERSEADASFTHIVFKNSGQGYAQHIKFEILKNFEHYDNDVWNLKNKGIIQNGIDRLYSNQSFKYYFTDLSQNNKEKISDNMEIRTTYYDLNEKKYSKIVTLSLLELSGIGILNPPDNYIGRISFELTEIKKLLRKVIDKSE